MHQPLKSLSLVTATLLLALASPLQTAGTNLGASIAQAQAPTTQDRKADANVEGTWTITEAKTLDGRNYTGTVAIQPIGQIYNLSWQTSVGKQSGIAFFENGHLFGGWGTDEEAGYGVVVYKIGKDGTLDGKWTYSKQEGEIGTETATGGRPDQIEGDYQVSGTNPNETGRYKGTLNIRRTGDTYQVTWAVGTSYRGVGIRSGDWLVVSWGQSEQLGVVDYAISGDKASGRSARFNQSSLGVENLVHSQASASLSLSCTPAQTPTTQNQKAQADCFLEQGIKQIDTNRYQVGLQSLQRALAIYREIQDRQGEGQTLKNLGNAYYGLKDYIKAREYQQQALAIARHIHDRELEGRALNNLGLAYKELGDSNKAIESYQQALAIAQEIHNRKLEQIALNNLGFIYNALGKPAKAVEYYQQVLAIAREFQNHDLEWSAITTLVSAYDSLKDNQKIIEFAQQGLTLARKTQNRKWERLALNTLIGTYTSLGDFQKVVEYRQQSLAIARETKDRKSEGKILIDIGLAYEALKNYQQAIASYQQSLAIAQDIYDRVTEGWSLNNIGGVYHQQGDYNQAFDYYQRSLAIAKAIPDKQMQVKVLTNLGNAYSASGNYSKAIEYYQQLLVLAGELKERSTEVAALAYLDDAYASLNDNQKAIAYYQQALALARETKNSEVEAAALNVLSRIYSSLGDAQKSLEFAQQALAVARQIKNKVSEVGALALTGNAYAYLNDNQKAIEFAQQALTLARETKNSWAEATALDTLTRAYSSLGDAQKSLEFAQQDLAVARQIKNKVFEVRALAFIGNAYASLNEKQKAIEFAQQALTLARETKNFWVEALALDTLSRTYSSLGDAQKSLEFAQQVLAVARQIKNKVFEVRALLLIGNAYASLNEKQKAIEFAQQNLALARKIKNRDLESTSLIVTSGVYLSLRDYQKALEFAQESLDVAREIKNRDLESRALYFLGNAYLSLRDYQKSLEYIQQALAIHRELKDHSSELFALHMLGTNYFYLGDYQKLIELTQQELELARKIKDYDYEGGALANMSHAYYAQGDPKKTIELGQQALAVGRKNKSPNAEFGGLFALSIGYANLGNNEKALEFAQESLAIARDPNHRGRVATNAEWLALNIMGSIYRKVGRQNQAITAYRESLAIDESGFNAKVGLSRIYRELNMPITAITYYKQAISNVEQIRGKIIGLDQQSQKSFLQAMTVDIDRTKNSDIYRELADLLLSQGRILEAQQVLELLKVKEIREFTRDTRAGGKNPEVALNQTEEQIKKENGTLIAFGQRLYECQQTRCNQLSQLLDQREALTEQFNQKVQTIEKQVRDRKSQDDAFLDPTKLGLKAKEIVEAQPGTVLIYPLVLEDKIWLLWASKGGIIKSVEVPNVGQQQLAQTVLKFRQLLQSPSSNIAELQATGKQLYDWLIKPIEPELKENKIQNLVFSLDRAARYIPMSALFDGEKYLIENYAVSTVLSADLTNTSDRIPPGTQNTSVLALGLSNAVPGFNPLPNVPAELDAIVRKQPNDTKGIYPGLKFLNKDFDWRSLRDNLLGHRLLHIATHGEFVPGSPDASYLLLGTGEKLAIPKIATLQDLGNVSLVVLSACQTALGEPGQDGNEINGISYYFLNAGAKAVMASLWSVDDDSTRQLMQQFYGNLAKGTPQAPITKAQALRQAQLTLLTGNKQTANEPRGGIAVKPELTRDGKPTSPTTRLSHPYYWAPFILIGNGL